MLSQVVGRPAVRLVRSSGKLIREVADDLGVSEKTLRTWVRQGDVDDGRRSDGLTPEREELRQLRRRVRVWSRSGRSSRRQRLLRSETDQRR